MPQNKKKKKNKKMRNKARLYKKNAGQGHEPVLLITSIFHFYIFSLHLYHCVFVCLSVCLTYSMYLCIRISRLIIFLSFRNQLFLDSLFSILFVSDV